MFFKKLVVKTKRFLNLLVLPKTEDKDLARRELILNILFLGSLILSFFALLETWISFFLNISGYRYQYIFSSLIVTFVFFLFLALFFLSKVGKYYYYLSAIILLSTYFLAATFTAYTWGATAPQTLLIYAFIIVASGILINSISSLITTAIVSLTVFILIYFQSNNIIVINSSWKNNPAGLDDAINYSITFFIIALVSWLFNKEMEKALGRAQFSEKALKRERDLLEVKVEQRTKDLKREQMEKLIQIYRFSEFGRMASGLFHDIATPINLISLNIARLHSKKEETTIDHLSDAKTSLKRATIGIKRLENFVNNAKKQLKNQMTQTEFSPYKEIKDILEIFTYKAKSSKIKVTFLASRDIILYGNHLRFGQLINNLLLNAFDSYEGVENSRKRKIEINMKKYKRVTKLSITDSGKGISEENLEKIFEPFFTTKSSDKGTGLGLSICKDIIEKDFGGKIKVKSKVGRGSTFEVILPNKKML